MKKSDVLEHFGTGAAVGRALGISRQTVASWPELVPVIQARRLHEATNGELLFEWDDYLKDESAA